MKLSAIALKNLKRNFSFYSLYLFSVSFVLMIYFCFTSFSMNQIIMEKISSDGRVETMCRTVAVFIMAFVIFYMFYSNSFFMRRRMRELGIYSLLGYRKSTILKLLIFENVLSFPPLRTVRDSFPSYGSSLIKPIAATISRLYIIRIQI